MHWMDAVNGVFEIGGGMFVLLSVLQILKDKQVHGVHWLHVTFFASWGCWNLLYYPHLDQWLSFVGGIWLAAVNLVWVVLIVHYIRFPRGRHKGGLVWIDDAHPSVTPAHSTPDSEPNP